MRILDRYIGRQLLVTALFAVAVLTFVLVLGTVFKKLLDLLVNHNAPPGLIFSLIGYMMPFSLTFTIPWGFLTAVLMVFGRMSAENELTALRSNGVSIPRASAAVWGLAAVFTAVCVWINLDVAPRAQQQMRNAIFDIATSNPLALFGSDKVIEDFPGQLIYVEKSEGGRLTNLLVYKLDTTEKKAEEANKLVSVMFAREGTLSVEPAKIKGDDGIEREEMALLLRFKDCRYEHWDEKFPDDLSRIKNGITVEKGTAVISLRELHEKKRKAGGVGTKAIAELLSDEQPEATIEFNKRLSNALATIAFALLGIPLAVTAQRKETSAGFAISLAIGLAYYLLLFLADMARGRPKLHPELLIWVPNVLFLTIGAIRFWRLARR